MNLTLEGLQAKVNKNRDSLRARQKERYSLAKSLGFSPDEAVILQNQKEEVIRRLARERKDRGK